MASSSGLPFAAQLIDEADHHDAVEHSDAAQGDEADAGGDGKRDVTQPERKMPPVSASGTPLKTSSESFTLPKAMKSRMKISSRASGTTIWSRLRRGLELLELAAPRDPIAAGKFHFGSRSSPAPRRQTNRCRVREYCR